MIQQLFLASAFVYSWRAPPEVCHTPYPFTPARPRSSFFPHSSLHTVMVTSNASVPTGITIWSFTRSDGWVVTKHSDGALKHGYTPYMMHLYPSLPHPRALPTPRKGPSQSVVFNHRAIHIHPIRIAGRVQRYSSVDICGRTEGGVSG